MYKKIKVTVPKNIYDIIENDISDFNLSNNNFMNYIFANLKNNYEKKEKKVDDIIVSDEKKVIQFSLNKRNTAIYYDVLKDKKIQNESEFIRNLLFKYTTNSKNMRELFIFKEIVERINLAIKDKKNVFITFYDDRKVKITPYFIGSSELEIANYIFCYDHDEKKFRNYKLNKIKEAYTSSELGKWDNISYIRKTIKNFDPFLSDGNIVKVKLTGKGINFLNNLKTNRPKILKINENIYEFKSSQEQAKRYFAYFLDEATILEPEELKEWFKKKYENALKNYDD